MRSIEGTLKPRSQDDQHSGRSGRLEQRMPSSSVNMLPGRQDMPTGADSMSPTSVRFDDRRPWGAKIEKGRDGMPPRRDSMPPRRDNMPSRRDGTSPRRDDMPPRRHDMSPRRDDMPPRRDDMPPRRDDMSPISDGNPHIRDGMPYRRDSIQHTRDGMPSGDDDMPTRREGMPPKIDDVTRKLLEFAQYHETDNFHRDKHIFSDHQSMPHRGLPGDRTKPGMPQTLEPSRQKAHRSRFDQSATDTKDSTAQQNIDIITQTLRAKNDSQQLRHLDPQLDRHLDPQSRKNLEMLQSAFSRQGNVPTPNRFVQLTGTPTNERQSRFNPVDIKPRYTDMESGLDHLRDDDPGMERGGIRSIEGQRINARSSSKDEEYDPCEPEIKEEAYDPCAPAINEEDAYDPCEPEIKGKG